MLAGSLRRARHGVRASLRRRPPRPRRRPQSGLALVREGRRPRPGPRGDHAAERRAGTALAVRRRRLRATPIHRKPPRSRPGWRPQAAGSTARARGLAGRRSSSRCPASEPSSRRCLARLQGALALREPRSPAPGRGPRAPGSRRDGRPMRPSRRATADRLALVALFGEGRAAGLFPLGRARGRRARRRRASARVPRAGTWAPSARCSWPRATSTSMPCTTRPLPRSRAHLRPGGARAETRVSPRATKAASRSTIADASALSFALFAPDLAVRARRGARAQGAPASARARRSACGAARRARCSRSAAAALALLRAHRRATAERPVGADRRARARARAARARARRRRPRARRQRIGAAGAATRHAAGSRSAANSARAGSRSASARWSREGAPIGLAQRIRTPNSARRRRRSCRRRSRRAARSRGPSCTATSATRGATVTLDNGARLELRARDGDQVALAARFARGAALDPPALHGRSALLATLMATACAGLSPEHADRLA